MNAILVIKGIDYCGECPCCVTEQSFWGDICKAVCQAENNKHVEVYLDGVSGFPSWCPLRPLPQYQQYKHSTGGFTRGFTKGWNTCIKEITGETK